MHLIVNAVGKPDGRHRDALSRSSPLIERKQARAGMQIDFMDITDGRLIALPGMFAASAEVHG